MAEVLKWLEQHISTSLQPKLEELKTFMSNCESRAILDEFLINDQSQRLYIYTKQTRELAASLLPPVKLHSKSLFFLKNHQNTIITKDNIDDEIQYFDCLPLPLEQLRLETREVFLPLICNNPIISKSSGYDDDRLLTILHNLLYTADIGQGLIEGEVVLAQPSLDILVNVAANPKRHPAVKYLLETTVISWISETKIVLSHDAIQDLFTNFGGNPTPDDEVKVWSQHLEKLQSLLTQLDMPVAQQIIYNLRQVDSQYANSVTYIRKQISKIMEKCQAILSHFRPLWTWHCKICQCTNVSRILPLFKPLMTVLFLIWSHSAYYHQKDKFSIIIQLLCNFLVKKARNMIGADVLTEPLKSHERLKKALQICATFRGTYLDFKANADVANRRNVQQLKEKKPEKQMYKMKLHSQGTANSRFNNNGQKETSNLTDEDFLLADSPWPHRNSSCFKHLNSFMERCNDVLELVETAQHFQELSKVAEVGGIGDPGIDLVVKEICVRYTNAISEFFLSIDDLMDVKESQSFEISFFKLRSVVKSLETQLSGILHEALTECPTPQSKMRLLEVFRTTTTRPQVKAALVDIMESLVEDYWKEVTQIQTIFDTQHTSPPLHHNFSAIMSKIIWIQGLLNHIQTLMFNMKQVCPHALEGDNGWTLKEHYSELLTKFELYKSDATCEWQDRLALQLTGKLKEVLLLTEEFDETLQERPSVIHVNLDTNFLMVLREMQYLSQEPFCLTLQVDITDMLGDISLTDIQVAVTRLRTVTLKYNTIFQMMKGIEKPLFEGKLLEIDQLIDNGVEKFTWKMRESFDFIESAMSLVCSDVYQNLQTLQSNCEAIFRITSTWTDSLEGIPVLEDPLSMEQLLEMKSALLQQFRELLLPSNNRIGTLVTLSVQAVQVSEVSPCWQDYLGYIDMIVLRGLQKAIVSHLNTLLSFLYRKNALMDLSFVPLLAINVVLVDRYIDFEPLLDQSSCFVSVSEVIHLWITEILTQASVITTFSQEGNYQEFIESDIEIQNLVLKIGKYVEDTVSKCKDVGNRFEEFSYLWTEDSMNSSKDSEEPVSEIFNQELNTKGLFLEQNEQHAKIPSDSDKIKDGIDKENISSQLTLKNLSEFDTEASKYMNIKQTILAIPEYTDIGWIRVNMEPIKQTINAISSKWLSTYTKKLALQVTAILEELDDYIKGVEAEMEHVTGKERDVGSFTRVMRLFNQITSAQPKVDASLSVIAKTVMFLEKYQQELPTITMVLYQNIPVRWNNFRSKISLAKQNLGPTIQEESTNIIKELNEFNVRVFKLQKNIQESQVTRRDMDTDKVFNLIRDFFSRLMVLEEEAQDLKELENVLETFLLEYDDLKICRDNLIKMEAVWKAVRYIDKDHTQWKACLWQNIDVGHLAEEIEKELAVLGSFSEDVIVWNVYRETYKSVKSLQACVSLIADLMNPNMRTRHWRQLLRVTNTAIDSEFLNQLTLEHFLNLDFQRNIDEVQSIVNRAVKELVVEKAMKNCEEVWLSHIFDLHLRRLPKIELDLKQQSDSRRSSQLLLPDQDTTPSTTRSSSIYYGSYSSLSASRMSMADSEQLNMVGMLTNTDTLFQELIHHQITLNNLMQNQNTASFNDEMNKWHGQLLTIETVVILWQKVQDRWDQLIEAFAKPDIQVLLPNETRKFRKAHLQFCRLMKSVEKIPNILQNCTKKWIQPFLEGLLFVFEKCYKALVTQVDKFRILFPRFYLISPEEVLQLVCYGTDLSSLNMHLKKVLPNVEDLQFSTSVEDNNEIPCIAGVTSETNEHLHFLKPVLCDGPIQQWLLPLVLTMEESLRHHLTQALGYEDAWPVQSTHISSSTPDTQKSNNQLGSINLTQESGRIKVYSRIPVPRQIDYLSALDVTILERFYSNWSWVIDTPVQIVSLVTKVRSSQEMIQIMNEDSRKCRELFKQYVSKTKSDMDQVSKILGILEKEKRKTLQSDYRESRLTDELSGGGKTNEQLSTLGLQPHVYMQQISKLKCLLLCQSQLSELLVHLLGLCDKSDVHPKQNFTWKMQLNYSFDSEKKSVAIESLGGHFDYGFEYLGSVKREIVTPMTQRAFAGLLNAITYFHAGLCIGPSGGQKFETVQELSHCLGKAIFSVNCSTNLSNNVLQDVLKGMMLTGCWICLNNIENLEPHLMTLLAEEVQKIFEAYKSGQLSMKTENGELKIQPGGVVIGVLSSTNQIRPYDSAKLSLYPAATASLPQSLIKHFRPVSCLCPSFQQTMEILLYVHGFTHGVQLASNMKQLLQHTEKMCSLNKRVLSSNVEISSDASVVGCGLGRIEAIIHEAAENLNINRLAEISVSSEQSATVLKMEEDVIVVALLHLLLPQLEMDEVLLVKKLVQYIWPEVTQKVISENCYSFMAVNNDLDLSPGSMSLNMVTDANENPIATILYHDQNKTVDTTSITDNNQITTATDFMSTHNIDTLIKDATMELNLCCPMNFLMRVKQLYQLSHSHPTVLVVGPAGCGKSCCIDTFVAAKRTAGSTVSVDSLFLKSQESEELMGYLDPDTSEWIQGLLPSILGKVCKEMWLKNNITDDNENGNDAFRIIKLNGMVSSGFCL